jgi:hypothetical protein
VVRHVGQLDRRVGALEDVYVLLHVNDGGGVQV